MLNVKTLTDTMSRMQLPQLQQYAALHKNDPYIVTLALSIANQKKQMLAGKAGQAGMMPQSTVVDQDIFGIPLKPQPRGAVPQQQALPEDSGIGQLPAQNMQGMAGGGIVAFDDGGSVPGYATGVFTGEENIPDWLKVFPPESGIRRTYRAMNQYDKNNPMPVYPTVPATAPAAAPALPPSATQVMSGLPAVKAPPPPPPPPPPGTGAPTVKPAGLPALNTTPLTPEQAMTAGQKFGDEAALKAGIARLDTDAVNTNASIQAAHEKGLAALSKPGTEAEARLKAREAQDVVGQADAKAMAIFKAGLGMMAGTSQYAFENIGKGAMAGLEDYSASIKDFRKLGIERDKAYAEIEAARNAAARDDFKTSIGLQEKGADRLARAHEKGIDLTANLFKTNKETAATIYRDSFDQAQQNLRTQTTEAGATGRTIIQAHAPTGLERIYRNPELFKKHMEAQTAATGIRGDTAHRETWAKSPYLQSQYPKIDDYLRAMGVHNTVNMPANAPNVLP